MRSRDDSDWERLARSAPYWAVLTDPRYRGESLDPATEQVFFASGEEHVSRLFGSAAAVFGRAPRPERALDFGCGVGRVLPALARRCTRVVGADIAPRMVELARAHVRRLELRNCEVLCTAGSLDALSGEFDFIHSALVFQHIAPKRGAAYLAQLCTLLRVGGQAVLHFATAAKTGGGRNRLIGLGEVVRPLHVAGNVLRGRPPGEPPIRMYTYSVESLRRIVERSGCIIVHVSAADDDSYSGVLLWLRRDQ